MVVVADGFILWSSQSVFLYIDHYLFSGEAQQWSYYLAVAVFDACKSVDA